jgi:hypothetical protein
MIKRISAFIYGSICYGIARLHAGQRHPSGKRIRPKSRGNRKLAKDLGVSGSRAFQDMEGMVSSIHNM